jgi:hypothetical protein
MEVYAAEPSVTGSRPFEAKNAMERMKSYAYIARFS